LASAAPDWQAAMLPATVPLWLLVASGMRWASQPEAGRGRRRAAIALVVLLPALNLATNHRQAGRARAGRDFVQRYVAGLERLEPGAPTIWSASQAVGAAFSVPQGAVALAGIVWFYGRTVDALPDGSRVTSMREDFGAPGPGIMRWDGRDQRGDEIANGTYLFVLRGLGAAEQDADLIKTGKLVIMR